MAISIPTEPDTITAAYRPILWTAISNDSDIVRMIADVKINGTIRENSDQDVRIGTSGTFDFDVQSTAQDFLTFNNQSISGNSLINAGSSEVEVLLDFYEVLETTANLLSTAWRADGSGTPDATGSTIWAINTTLQHEETQDMDIYTIDNFTKKFLTNAPSTQRIGSSETIQLSFVSNISNIKFRIEQFNSAGATISNVLSSATAMTDKAGVVLVDASGMLAAAVKFTVSITDNTNVTISETRTFTIDRKEYDVPIRLKWLNPLGGMDSYTFVSKKVGETRGSFKSFEKLLDNPFTINERGKTVLSSKSRDAFEVWSRAEPRATLLWLAEILGNHVQAFIDDGTNFIPILITSRKAKYLDSENELFQMSFKYEKSHDRESQRN